MSFFVYIVILTLYIVLAQQEIKQTFHPFVQLSRNGLFCPETLPAVSEILRVRLSVGRGRDSG